MLNFIAALMQETWITMKKYGNDDFIFVNMKNKVNQCIMSVNNTVLYFSFNTMKVASHEFCKALEISLKRLDQSF